MAIQDTEEGVERCDECRNVAELFIHADRMLCGPCIDELTGESPEENTHGN